MEAPEKIYLSDFTDTTEAVFYVKSNNTKKTDIEYSRTDAFIEKAAVWFANRYQVNGSYLNAHDIEDFEKFMKGE